MYSFDDSTGILNFYYGTPPSSNELHVGEITDNGYYEQPEKVPWFAYIKEVRSVTFGDTFAKNRYESLSYWFYGMDKLTSINLSGFSPRYVMNFSHAFENDNSLTSVKFFDGTNEALVDTKDTKFMFSGVGACLKTVDFTGLKANGFVEDERMFGDLESVHSIPEKFIFGDS